MAAGDRARSNTAPVIVAGVVTAALLAVALLAVLRSGTDPANTSAPGYLGLAYVAAAVLLAVFVIGALVRRLDLQLAPGFPWLVGAVSFLASWSAWLIVWLGNLDLGGIVYRGLHVPMGITQFWDLSLILQSIDCASVGVDVYAANNGCLKDPSIYGPGTLWLQWVPGIGNARVQVIGVALILASSLALLLLARWSSGLGQAVLLVAALGAPWLLLLERGNLDAIVICVGVLCAALVARWPRLWAWWVAAALIWVLGTWKYYPFAMGLMLLPALRIRRGWTVLVGFAVASAAFVVLTWENLQFSLSSNTNMIDYGDIVVLGRVPVVARMLGTVVGAGGIQTGDMLVLLLTVGAIAWGAIWARRLRAVPSHVSMLAVGGSVLYLVAVVLSGFGWGYKAAFLLMAVPLVARGVGHRQRAVVASAVIVLGLLGVSAVVAWNTVLATFAGVTAGGFALGAGLAAMLPLLQRGRARTPMTVS